MISAEIVAIDFLSSRTNASKRRHRRVCTSMRLSRSSWQDTRFNYYTLLCYLARYHFRTIMNENRRRPPYFQHRSSECVTRATFSRFDCIFFFFRSNTRLTLIHDAKGRAYTRDRSLRPEYLSQVRCDRREKCKGIDDRETNERAGRIRT